MKKLNYSAPEAGAIEIVTERGIAQSTVVEPIESLDQGIETEW
jgi:hypothetical protein